MRTSFLVIFLSTITLPDPSHHEGGFIYIFPQKDLIPVFGCLGDFTYFG
jgi:hypothetical protein